MSYKTIDRNFKTAPVAVIPVNPYFWPNSAEHDVALTSLTADYYDLGPNFCHKVWKSCPEKYGKFRVVICFSFKDILRNMVGAVSFPSTGRG